MKKAIKNQKSVIIFFGLIFVIPILMQLNPFGISTYLKKLVGIGTPREWLGFWGSYLGSIITVLFSYFSIMYETKKERDKEQLNLVRSRANLSKKGKRLFIFKKSTIESFKEETRKIDKYGELTYICDQLIESMTSAYNCYDKISNDLFASIYEDNKLIIENSDTVMKMMDYCLSIKSDAYDIKLLAESRNIPHVVTNTKEIAKTYINLVENYKKGRDTALNYANSTYEYFLDIKEKLY